MPLIRIWQYRADQQDGHRLDDVIAAWTGIFNPGADPYSHTEIELGDGMCFSSTTRDNAKGTRFEDAEVVLRNIERWDCYTKEVSRFEETQMFERARQINGRPYFYAGIFLDFFLPLGWLSNAAGRLLNQWYCSQAVWFVLTGKRERVSPKRLQAWIQKDGWQRTVVAGAAVEQ